MFFNRHFRKLIALPFFAASLSTHAADHIDFPDGLNITFPEKDLADLYAWVPKRAKNKIILAMNLHALADESTQFSSDNVEYRFRLRPVTFNSTSTTSIRVPQLVDGAEETTISCTVIQNTASCSTGNFSDDAWVNNFYERFKRRKALQVFAGTVRDPFTVDLTWAETSIIQTTPLFDPTAVSGYLGPVPLAEPSNALEGSGALNITVALDKRKVLGNTYSHYAVAGEVVVDGVVFDRMGRPEISNFVVRSPELKPMYNAADTFALTPTEEATFRALFAAGISGWDRLDLKTDWNENNTTALIDSFLLDALVMNVAQYCQDTAPFFSIERAAGPLNHLFDESCGGRKPSDDVVDSVTSLLVAGPYALTHLYGDGVDGARKTRRSWPPFAPLTPHW